MIIDEIQKEPNLLDEIKKKIDEQRFIWLKSGNERQLMYILTGSNRFELQQGVSDSLAGRCGILDMLSFSRAEREQNRLYPIEINKSSSPKNPTRNFSVLKKYEMEIEAGLIIDTCDKIRPFNDFAYEYPVYLLGM